MALSGKHLISRIVFVRISISSKSQVRRIFDISPVHSFMEYRAPTQSQVSIMLNAVDAVNLQQHAEIKLQSFCPTSQIFLTSRVGLRQNLLPSIGVSGGFATLLIAPNLNCLTKSPSILPAIDISLFQITRSNNFV